MERNWKISAGQSSKGSGVCGNDGMERNGTEWNGGNHIVSYPYMNVIIGSVLYVLALSFIQYFPFFLMHY